MPNLLRMQLSDLTKRVIDYLPHLIGALPVVAVVVVVAMVLNFVLGRTMILLAQRTHLTALDVLPIRRLLGWGIRIVAAILILSVFGFQIGGIWAMLSTILGLVAIGFVAVWSLISHTSATMLILFLRPFQVGDDVDFPGEPVQGRVVDINFFFTTLIDHEGALLQIPNNLFFQKTMRRRKNESPVSLAAQLNAQEAAEVSLPRPPVQRPDADKSKPSDPLMMLPDPRTIAPPVKPGR